MPDEVLDETQSEPIESPASNQPEGEPDIDDPIDDPDVQDIGYSDVQDIGDLAEVPEEEQSDTDGEPDDVALEGGPDDELEDVYDEPGAVVEGDLG